MALRLYPWRDGYEYSKKLLQDSSSDDQEPVKKVLISFCENDFKEYLQDLDAISLFEEIGSSCLHLESVTIKLNVVSKLPSSVAIPPIPALTSLLTANNNKIRYLTLLDLRLESHNDLDMNGMVEALRIHPTLQSIEVKNCTFFKQKHLNRLRSSLLGREEIKHCDLLNNRVSVLASEEERPRLEEYYEEEKEECYQEEEERQLKEEKMQQEDTLCRRTKQEVQIPPTTSEKVETQSFLKKPWNLSNFHYTIRNYPLCVKICLFALCSISIFLAVKLCKDSKLWRRDHSPAIELHQPAASTLLSHSSFSNIFMIHRPKQQHMPRKLDPALLSIMPWQFL